MLIIVTIFSPFTQQLSPTQKKVMMIALACLSLITLSYLTYRCFYKKVTDETEKPEPLLDEDEKYDNEKKDLDIKNQNVNDEEDLDNWDGKETEIPISPEAVHVYLTSEIEQGQKETEELIAQAHFDAAWLKYLKTACGFEEPSRTSLESNSNWKYLPPRALLEGLLAKYRGSHAILELMPPRFLRDCLMAYPQLFNAYTYACFKAYPEYVADICIKHKEIAHSVIANYDGTPIDSHLRLEIFNSAYPLIGKDLDEKTIHIRSMKGFISFLLNYHYPIQKDIFDKITKLERLIDKLEHQEPSRKDAKQFHILINLVITKLNHQGIYDDKGNCLDDKKIELEEKYLSRLSNSDQIDDLIQEICN